MVTATTPMARYAATTAMSPWLRLMTRIVPKSSERPQANSA